MELSDDGENGFDGSGILVLEFEVEDGVDNSGSGCFFIDMSRGCYDSSEIDEYDSTS